MPSISPAALPAAHVVPAAIAAHHPDRAASVYVDDDAPAGGDGSSWPSAFRHLQDALAAARSIINNTNSDPPDLHVEVRVARGTYKPDQGAGQTPADTNSTFLVSQGMSVLGGYAGLGAPNPDARDFKKFETILDGDLLGNDPPVIWPPPPQTAQHVENSLHIMTVLDADDGTLIEGLTCTKSSYLETFTVNQGGGILSMGGSPRISHCVFRHNRAYRGGGACLHDSDATIRDCSFFQNWAHAGAGINVGGVIGTTSYPSDAVLEDCVFTQNRCGGSGVGGAMVVFGGSVIERCQFFDNEAPMAATGGAVSCSSTTSIRHCRFERNSADMGGAIVGKPVIESCVFHDNRANWGGAIHPTNLPGELRCSSSVFTENFANFYGGAVQGSGSFVNCVFDSNRVFWDGGGAVTGGGTFVNCRFTRNVANLEGGGAVVLSGSNALFANCLFAGNRTTKSGGAVKSLPANTAHFANCDFVQNTSQNGPGALAVEGTCVMANCIFWSNGATPISGSPTVTYSCGDHGISGAGNIAADPLFVNALGPDQIAGTDDDNFRLMPSSPCIDASNSFGLPADAFDLDKDSNVAELLPVDFAGSPRFLNSPSTANTGLPTGPHPVADVGAFEFNDFIAVPGDVTADGVMNLHDLVPVLISWGACAAPCGPDVTPAGGDGFVNVNDLLQVIVNWSSPRSPR